MKRSGFLHLAKQFNNVSLLDLQMSGYLPFVFDNTRIGMVSPTVVEEMKKYVDVFAIHQNRVGLNPALKNYDSRSSALRDFLMTIRSSKLFPSLTGWRDECYEIRLKFSEIPIFKVERSATPLFGFKQYGVHINGFVETSENEKSIWIQRRSKTKPTYSGKLDTFVGGGFAEGLGVYATAVKELEEEAGITMSPNLTLQQSGSVSFLHKSERGIHPYTEFVFDLKLPLDFKPENKDGEVDDFILVSASQLLDLIQTEEYKTTSVPIALDWLIRHGLLTVEMEPDMAELLAEIHTPLDKIYASQITIQQPTH